MPLLQSQVDDLTNQVDDLQSLEGRVSGLEDAVIDLQDETSAGGQLDLRLQDTENNVSDLCDWMSFNAEGFFGC